MLWLPGLGRDSWREGLTELHECATPARFLSGMLFDRQDFDSKMAAMKEHRCTGASWDDAGRLMSATIEIPPDTTVHSEEPDLTPNERTKLAQRLKAERDERMRFGASGGPRPLGHDQR